MHHLGRTDPGTQFLGPLTLWVGVPEQNVSYNLLG